MSTKVHFANTDYRRSQCSPPSRTNYGEVMGTAVLSINSFKPHNFP